MQPSTEVGIVGGGMLGLTLALRLAQRGNRVTVIESGASPGGLAAPASIGDYTWDRFYHVILLSDSNLRGLLTEIGLADQLRWATTRTGFYVDGRLHSLSSALDFLKFPALSVVDKARLVATILHASRITDGAPLEHVTAEEWLEKWSGRRTVDKIWRPLLRAKLGTNYQRASASFIWASITRLYSARRSGLKREMFGHVEGGYDTILLRLLSDLGRAGVTVLSNTPVSGVRAAADSVIVRTANGTTLDFDNVVLTLPCSRIPAICPDLTQSERDRLGRVVYQGVVCASLLIRKSLSPYYITNITDADIPFTGVIEMTAVTGRERFGGNALVYLPRYLAQDDPFWQRKDGDIEAEFLTALERMYPGFRREDVAAFRIARAQDVMALSTLRYSDEALPSLRTSIPGVYIVNSAQIVNGTLNVNETVGLANASATKLASLLGRARFAATA